jgi:hypothetical protein
LPLSGLAWVNGLAQDQLEQRGLAGAVGAHQADLVAAQDRGAEVVHDAALAEGLGHIGELGHDLAAGRAGGHVQPHAAHGIAPRAWRLARSSPAGRCGPRAGAPGFHALADPDLFLRQQLVGLGLDHRLLGQLLFLLSTRYCAEVARVGAQDAAVELDDARGHAVQEGAVVGDGHHAALEVDQQLLQPLDRVQVQVVGGLVEQQHVGLAHQRLGQRHALAGAAGQRADLRLRSRCRRCRVSSTRCSQFQPSCASIALCKASRSP